MIRYGESIRFTSRELEEFRHIGLDFSDARGQALVEQALRTWAELIGGSAGRACMSASARATRRSRRPANQPLRSSGIVST